MIFCPRSGQKNALIVVAKRPAPGETKTRLASSLSPSKAARLYECFLLDTLDSMRSVPEVTLVIAYSPREEEGYFRELAPGFNLIPQSGPGLGQRLDHALSHFLNRGYASAVIMASDSPTLPASHLASAFHVLEGEADLVIGPCEDGGYYLIGLKRPAPRLLREVQMSTPTVTVDTLMLASAEGLRAELLPEWYDIDDVASLERLVKEIARLPAGTGRHTRAFLTLP